MPQGCAFRLRCPHRLDARCETERPPLREVREDHWSRCFYEVPVGEAAARSGGP
jgi:oligopeptide/dipeptide ABC transporter ATP-binding protein